MEAAWADLQALAEGDAGTLRVGTYQSVGARILPELMRRFTAVRPGVELQLTESSDDEELLALLERGELDLTFTVMPLPDGPFAGRELMSDPYVLLVGADSPWAGEERVEVADLAGLDVIGFRHCMSGARTVEHLGGLGIELRTVFRSDDNGTVQGLVGAGMASALVPLLAADADDPRTALVPVPDLPPRAIGLAWHRDRALSPSARALIEEAAGLCGALQASVASPG
jgi:DNA-binding transcriptional LysR family regulator